VKHRKITLEKGKGIGYNKRLIISGPVAQW